MGFDKGIRQIMNCEKCEAPLMARGGQIYRYTECGLDDVYLSNVEVLACALCSQTLPVIPRMKLLHEVIARAIALQPYALRGQDIRFLRKQLRFTAKEWAALLRVDVSTLSRWENDSQQIGTQADALIRYVYLRLVEQWGQRIDGNLAEQIAAAIQPRPVMSWVLIDSRNPLVYSYQCGEKRPSPLQLAF